MLKNQVTQDSGIETFVASIKDKISLSKKSEKKLRLVYAFADFIHHHQTRKDGSKFFEHPQEVVNILLDEKLRVTPISEKEIIIALLHDIIEDTEVEHFILESLFGESIADAVEILSKKHWTEYVEDIPESMLSKKEIAHLEKEPAKPNPSKKKSKKKLTLFVDAHNSNSAPSKLEAVAELLEEVRVRTIRILLYPNSTKISEKKTAEAIAKIFEKRFEKFTIEYVPSKFSQIPEYYTDLGERYPHIKDLARSLRNKDYYGNMQELDDATLQVKFADRVHNLRTTSHIKKEKIKRKIEETKKYFLPVARKRNPKMFRELSRLIAKLESELAL